MAPAAEPVTAPAQKVIETPESLFESERLKHESMTQRKQLAQFVCIGDELYNEARDAFKDLYDKRASTDTHEEAKQAALKLSNERLEIPQVPLTNKALPAGDPSYIRQLDLFVRSAWKIVYRNRANRRIQMLKMNHDKDMPEPKQASKLERLLAGLESTPTDQEQQTRKQANILFVPFRKVSVPQMPVMSCARPMQLAHEVTCSRIHSLPLLINATHTQLSLSIFFWLFSTHHAHDDRN
jgi:hypothetical protein